MATDPSAAAGPTSRDVPLLEVEGLTIVFPMGGRAVPVVRDVDLRIAPGRVLALVGESGSGKSLTALALIGLVPPPGRVTRGRIRWRGRDLRRMGDADLHRIRGREIGLVPQDPATALNPVFTVGAQIAETVTTHHGDTADARRRTIELLETVGVPEPARRADEYPHQLSGGLRQRVMIALALAGDPALLVADEPTTGLDAITQARIVDLLRGLVARHRGLLLISHDLRVVGACADEVAVMYAGQIVETGPAAGVLEHPSHPYTRGLLASIPDGPPGRPLQGIDGVAPRPDARPRGCSFAPRCPDRVDRCDRDPPVVVSPGGGAAARCHLLDPGSR